MTTSNNSPDVSTFQGLIFALERYWADQGCIILQPYDMEVGAGTFHTATFLRSIGPEPGVPPMCSPPAAPPTAVMAKIPTAFSTTTSFRWR